MKLICKEITVTGTVQGVGFRFATCRIAKTYGIKGYVKNLGNGNVFITAEGQLHQINEFIKWCYQGPSHARVRDLIISDRSAQNYSSFSIRH